MGDTKASASQAPRKRKKKGRPSLLDLQKRSLRLEKLEHDAKPRNPKPSPAPNPYARAHAPTPARRSARRNPAAAESSASEDDDDDEEEEGSGGRRKRKKLSFVLRVPSSGRPDPDSPTASGSDSDSRRKRRIDSVGADDDRRKAERQSSIPKATDLPREPSESGPMTPLPDKKLLAFILDRLQKKDTYGVFSEPVDPTELPDYHEIIEHPMDFGTIRKKLESGAYGNLEQFENDVFLISSNAMKYNSPDTIYFRQARAIQELAKKNFENLRQESDDSQPQKPARRGRPPSKNIVKRVGRPPADRAGSDFSSSMLANVDNGHWSKPSHDSSLKGLEKSSEVSTRPYSLRNLEAHSWSELKLDRNEDIGGSATKMSGTKYGKKFSVIDENRRITYKQAQLSGSANESSVLMAFDGERKQLLPVGLQAEYAYARSLARFAANLGPTGWEIAAKKIERVLPPGMKFGRGWIGENDLPQQSLQVELNRSATLSTPKKVASDARISAAEQPSDGSDVDGVNATTILPAASSSTVPNSKPAEFVRDEENGLKSQSGGTGHGIWPKTPFQLQQLTSVQTTLNGFNQPSQLGKTVLPSKPPENLGSEMIMTHSRVLDMVSRGNNSYIKHAQMNHFNIEKMNLAADLSASSPHSGNHLHNSGSGVQGPWRSLSLSTKQGSVAPDLNVGLQSPRSPASGVLVDSQHANLSLQL